MPKDPFFLKIPTKRIRPNPNQPRRFITQSAIDTMEASLREIGQQTPAKVRALTEAEKALDPDHDYELIGGHIRHAGALKTGLATLDCLVLDLTPEQAELAGLVDNQSTDMHWLDWVIAIEKLNQGHAKLKQQAIADRLGMSVGRVNNALKVAKALTPASRELIFHNVKILGPEKAVSEFAVRALADLGDPKEVERAMPVFLDRRMTAPQAKTLVKHLKEGKPLEAYNHSSAPKSPQPGVAQTPAPTQPASLKPPPNQPLFNYSTPVPKLNRNPTLPEAWELIKAAWNSDDESVTNLDFIVHAVRGVFTLSVLWGIGWLAFKAVFWIIHLI